MTAPHGTARDVAAFRALETSKPPTERLFADPYAAGFLPPPLRLLVHGARFAPVRRLLEAYADRRAPGARTSAVARTRWIDDQLRAEAADQLVVLGAGLDCRALRLPTLRRATVFEVDRPATVAIKEPAPNVRRVGLDLREGRLAEALLEVGYDPAVRTVFLWEGVTNYLDADSVGAVLDAVGAAAPGSRLLFTYVHADAVLGRFDAPGLEPLLTELRARGEPWTFGIEPGRLPALLAAHGLALLDDLGAAEYRRLYWPWMAEQGVGYEFYHLVRAEVARAEG